MKKLLLLLIFAFSFSLLARGQCEPDPAYTAPGIYPDSATGFPPAYATFLYNLVITAVIPADTLFPPLPWRIPIDSIGVVEVMGLPEGFSAIPSRVSGFWPGGTSGCMLITGTPTEEQIGNHPLTFKLEGFLAGGEVGIPYEVTFYSITVLDSAAAGIRPLPQADISNMSASPNPFSNSFELSFHSFSNTSYEIQIFNLVGKKVISKTVQAKVGKNRYIIHGSELRPGIYFCRLKGILNETSGSIKLVRY